ncbi:MAG: lipid II:glycine glycyltransferase FemX [Anaerolineales bacterium]|jgi:lipid II:glycine glycyltransferase (peptidoglycan interpeptide bridge formation enzyme)
MPKIHPRDWTEFLASYPNAHILQTEAWGHFKTDFGWKAVQVISRHDLEQSQCGAQILFRYLSFGFSIAYIPKGPVGERWDLLWPEVDAVCKERRTIFLKVEPDLWEGISNSDYADLATAGFQMSQKNIQPPRTLIVDLNCTEDQILARMKQKTRYNIRLAQRKGVVIYKSRDIDTFYKLMQATSERDAFGIHSKDYYHRVLDYFEPHGQCALLFAEFDGQPLAGLMVFAKGKRAWYFYGASSNELRHLMPTYLLQWEAMKWAKDIGCDEYDLWGVPDESIETLESQFLERTDDLWSVYRFKRGFGGNLRRTVNTFDRVYRPGMYQLYLWIIRQKLSLPL